MSSQAALGGNRSFSTVTEVAGEPVSQEQIRKLYLRYCWAREHCAGKDVVEVACGTGPGLAMLADASRSVVAGDLDSELVLRARSHYGDRVPIEVFSADGMPFANASKDVVLIVEAIYYLPDVEAFVRECRRVLRPHGKVLVVAVNPDVSGFHTSEFSHRYFGVPQLFELFAAQGFDVKIFGSSPVDSMAFRQRILSPLKRLAVLLGLMPKTMAGKRWLKRIVFGPEFPMPAEIDCSDFDCPDPVPVDPHASNRRFQNLHCIALMD